MLLGVVLAVFVAPALSASTGTIDIDTLTSVFGYSNGSYPAQSQVAPILPLSPLGPVAAVSPSNGTLVDPDYWDADEFSPAQADYDSFDWSLTKRVASMSTDNFLLSPLGLKLALAILTEAATGQTQAEMAGVLGFDVDRNIVRQKFANIIKTLQTKHPQFILNLGSRIYVGDTANPRQRFAAIAKDSYNTDITPIDFNMPEEAAKDINGWISNITEGRIKHLVNKDDLASIAVMVLNTLYFKGTWRHQFPPNATKNNQFFVTPKLQKQVPFMNIRGRFYYTYSTKFDAKILRMPYVGNKNSMYIIVPNSLMGLSQVMAHLSELRSEMFFLQDSVVDVTLPRFQFDYTAILDDTLRDLGIRQAFEDTASFPGIARGQNLKQRLKISKVLQRSGVEVNELGSVAYSATEIALVNKFGEDSYTNHEVIANKPFLFFIQDEQTKQLLFTGRVSDPTMVDGAL